MTSLPLWVKRRCAKSADAKKLFGVRVNDAVLNFTEILNVRVLNSQSIASGHERREPELYTEARRRRCRTRFCRNFSALLNAVVFVHLRRAEPAAAARVTDGSVASCKKIGGGGGGGGGTLA